MHDRAVQVQAPVPPVLFPYPVVVGMTVDGDGSRAMEGVVRFNRVRLKGGSRGNQLEDGAWRKLRLDGLVHQRLQRVRGQPSPLLAVDTVSKVVWVEGRMADHCQDFASAGGESY